MASTGDTPDVLYWAGRDWIANQRKIVTEIQNEGRLHKLGHPTFRDQEVNIINDIFEKISGDKKATALLTHITAFYNEKKLLF